MPKEPTRTARAAQAADAREERAEQAARESVEEISAGITAQAAERTEVAARLAEVMELVRGLECTCMRDGIGAVREQCARCRILARAAR